MRFLSGPEKGGLVTQAKFRLVEALYEKNIPIFYKQYKDGKFQVLESSPAKQLKIIPDDKGSYAGRIIVPVISGFEVCLGLCSPTYPKPPNVRKKKVDLWDKNHAVALVEAVLSGKIKGLELNVDSKDASLLIDSVSVEQEVDWMMKSDDEREALLTFLTDCVLGETE